ncbi:hypothetical protein CALCODRAFT_408476, partial [Calocera cornea HHB12733]
IQSGYQLQLLFAILLLHCYPAQPEILWQGYKCYICDDLEHRLQQDGRRQNPSADNIEDYDLY